MRLTSRPGGVKEELILSGPGAPDRFVFPLKLKGLTAAMDGVDIVYRDSKGVERARTNRGYMYDSKVDELSDEPAFSEGVTYALIAYGKGTALQMRLDRAWLDSPDRAWPVVVDPEVHVNYNWDDTYVMSPYSTNYTGDPELKVGTFNGGGNVARAFMHFGTAEFTHSNVTMAYLYAYEKHSYNCGVNPGGAFRVLDSNWNPSSTVSMPGPAIDGNGVGGLWSGTACHDRVAYWDIRGMAQHWSNTGTTNGSVSLRAWNEGNSHEWKKYDSANTATAPFIAAWYNRPPNVVGELTPTNLSIKYLPQVSLGGRYSDPHGNPGSIAFYVYRYSNNELAWVGWSPQVSSGSMAYATTSNLSDDWYYVRAVAYDGQDISGWSSDNYFYVDTLRPTVAWVSPGDNSTVGSPVTVRATYNEPHSLPGKVLFAVNRLDGTGVTSQWSGQVSPGQTAEASLTITQPGQYDFYAIGNDGNGDANAYGLAWNGPHRITVANLPSIPMAPQATVNGDSVSVAFGAPANNGGSSVTSYRVRAHVDGTDAAGPEKTCGAPCTFVEFEDGLTAGTSYKFKIYARNAVGESAAAITNAVTAPAHTPMTVISLSVPVILDVLTQLLGSLGLAPSSFTEELPDGVGGYENEGMLPVAQAVESYETLREQSGLEGEPMITDFAIPGEVPVEVFSSIPVANIDVIDLAEVEERIEEEPVQLPNPRFLPQSGEISTTDAYPITEAPFRTIRNSMTWSSQESIDDFGEDYAYEHDLKFLNNTNSSSIHPACTHDELEKFWIFRGRPLSGISWYSNLPKSSRPYLDTPALDPCTQQDYSIGVAYPSELSPDKEYRTVVTGLGTVEAGTSVEGRRYELAAQKVKRAPFCPSSWIGNLVKWCVGVTNNNPIVVPIIEAGLAPQCRTWTYGVDLPGGTPC